MKKIKIGQLGIGHNHGHGKMATVRALGDVFDIVGVCEPDERWLKERGGFKEYEGLKFMTLDELFSSGVDAVMVESDVKDLMKYAKMCVERGISIHLDKPAGEDFDEFEDIINTAKKNNTVVQLAYMYRYNPGIVECMKMFREGKYGKIYHIDAQMCTEHSDEYRKWLSQFKGGSMYIFGSHLIDLVVYFLGEPKKVHSVLSESGKNGVKCPDNCIAVLEYENGSCVIRTSSVEVNGFGRRQFVICGSDATTEIKPFETNHFAHWCDIKYADTSLTKNDLYVDNGITLGFDRKIKDRYSTMMTDFAKCVSGEMENPFSLDHELLAHKVTLAACNILNL